jgi:hypothetical protein
LNKCLWHKNGHTIAAGDDMGRVHVYELAEVSLDVIGLVTVLLRFDLLLLPLPSWWL